MNITGTNQKNKFESCAIRTLTFMLLCIVFTQTKAQVTIPSDKDKLLKGEPMGQTLVAERNNFPSPQKILTLKDQLGLSKDQIRKIDEMLKNSSISITVQGQEIVEAEEDLNNLFASDALNEKMLRTKLEYIGKLRANLRFTHLQTYLRAKQILSVNQWQRLQELIHSENK